MFLLCVTGIIYLFKPQIEAYLDTPYQHITHAHPIHRQPAKEIQAALMAIPHSHFLVYELPLFADSAGRVIVTDPYKGAIRVYVHPETFAILHQVKEDQRLEHIIFNLHGKLLLGNAGSMIMELVASWVIILAITGIYLWWSRKPGFGGGLLFPRVSKKYIVRDMHAIGGGWVSVILLMFLFSGLPWSFIWGNYLQQIEHIGGRLTSIEDWEIGQVSSARSLEGPKHAFINPKIWHTPPHTGHGHSSSSEDLGSMTALASIDPAFLTAEHLGFLPPVLMAPFKEKKGWWTIRSNTQNRPQRKGVLVNGKGEIQAWDKFEDKPFLDRLIAYGVAAHEGQLLGGYNQIFNLVVASILLVVSGSAFLLWVKKGFRFPPSFPRDNARKRKPSSQTKERFLLLTAVVMTSLILPVFGMSVVCIIIGITAENYWRKKFRSPSSPL